MCGRYTLATDAQVLVDLFQIEHLLFDAAAFAPRYNIAPSQAVPVVRLGDSGRELLLARWGLVPHWSRSCGLADPRLAAVPGEERVWIASGNHGRVARLGPGGSLEIAGIELPLRSIAEGVAEPDGGVTWCAGGALLRLDRRGALVRTQGGFGVLAAVARTDGVTPPRPGRAARAWGPSRSAGFARDSN